MLTEKNYDATHCKIECLLEEQDMVETITNSMAEPEHRYRRDMEAYQTYTRKDRMAGIFMLGSMRNDITLQFEKYCSDSLGYCKC